MNAEPELQHWYHQPVPPMPWQHCAACHGQTTLMYDPHRVNQAIELCDQCPVTRECNQWATQTRQEHGVWAGRLRTPGTWKRVPVTRHCIECGQPVTGTTRICSPWCRRTRKTRQKNESLLRVKGNQ